MTVEHIAGTMRHRVIVSENKTFRFGAQFGYGVQNIAAGMLLRPKAQSFGLRAKIIGVGGMIDVPNVLRKLSKSIFQVFGAVANFNKGVQKTFDDDNQRKEF